MKGLWPEDREAINGQKEKNASVKQEQRQRQDKMICASIEYDIDLVMQRENNGLVRRERKSSQKEGLEEGEEESQKLAATVLPCHCLRGFCVSVGSLLMSYHCVCVCVGGGNFDFDVLNTLPAHFLAVYATV